jgi:hypothetical protein
MYCSIDEARKTFVLVEWSLGTSMHKISHYSNLASTENVNYWQAGNRFSADNLTCETWGSHSTAGLGLDHNTRTRRLKFIVLQLPIYESLRFPRST